MPGILDNGDIILWAHRVGPDAGDRSVQGQESARVEWQVYADRPNASVYDLARSPKIPPVGEELWDYVPPPAVMHPGTGYPRETVDSTAYSYIKGALLSSAMAVVNHQWRQSSQDPFVWFMTVIYEGKTDPLAEPSEVFSQIIEETEHVNFDVYGRLVANTSGEAYGGMPRDTNEKIITITRNVPYDLWDMDLGAEYHHSLNALDFPLSRQFRDVPLEGGPPGATIPKQVILPPGTVRIKKITEQEMVRKHGLSPLDRLYYWRVIAELAIDKRVVYMPNGTVAPRLHRWVTVNAGHSEWFAGRGVAPIRNGFATTAIKEHFLDVNGRAIKPPPPPPEFHELVAGGSPPNSGVWGNPDVYVVAKGGTMTVKAPGVLLNDVGGSSCSVDTPPPGPKTAAFSLLADGKLVFAPNPAVVNEWVTFTYRVHKGAATSDPVRVFILVSQTPAYLFFNRYKYADWTPLAPILSNW